MNIISICAILPCKELKNKQTISKIRNKEIAFSYLIKFDLHSGFLKLEQKNIKEGGSDYVEVSDDFVDISVHTHTNKDCTYSPPSSVDILGILDNNKKCWNGTLSCIRSFCYIVAAEEGIYMYTSSASLINKYCANNKKRESIRTKVDKIVNQVNRGLKKPTDYIKLVGKLGIPCEYKTYKEIENFAKKQPRLVDLVDTIVKGWSRGSDKLVGSIKIHLDPLRNGIHMSNIDFADNFADTPNSGNIYVRIVPGKTGVDKADIDALAEFKKSGNPNACGLRIGKESYLYDEKNQIRVKT